MNQNLDVNVLKIFIKLEILRKLEKSLSLASSIIIICKNNLVAHDFK